MIAVVSDIARRRVSVLMTGLLTIDEVRRFSDEEQSAIRRMGLGSGESDLLVTAVGNFVQTQDVTNKFMRLVMDSPLKARRIAIVRDGFLARMQAERVSEVRSNFEVFGNVADADAWLDEVPVCFA